MQMLEDRDIGLSLNSQCKLLGLNRSSVYYKNLINDESELANYIQEIYLSSDCRYGYRKITAGLREIGIIANHKKVLKLMQDMGIQGLYPSKFVNTTIKGNHAVYPYLLENLEVKYPDQVWATDLTYIKLPDKFMYFMAIIDLYSRYVIAYELSSNLEAVFCIDVLKRALQFNSPEIFNTDQGSQFTCNDFIKPLLAADIKISMDHKGRCFDNIFVERLWRTLKQESIYYYRPETVLELENCINEFVDWYNNKRLHQSLGYTTPKSMYIECR